MRCVAKGAIPFASGHRNRSAGLAAPRPAQSAAWPMARCVLPGGCDLTVQRRGEHGAGQDAPSHDTHRGTAAAGDARARWRLVVANPAAPWPGQEILQSIRELKAGKGRVVLSPAIEARSKTGLSQSQFAALLGVSVRTLQGWEQGRKQPSGAARTLLAIARSNPKAVLAVSKQHAARTE